MTVPIRSDSFYEFRAFPAGEYPFLAGNVGSGFEANRDIGDFDVKVDWGVMKDAVVGDVRMGTKFQEAMVRSSLTGLHEMPQTYQRQYPLGSPATLKRLGPPSAWAWVDADHAGLVVGLCLTAVIESATCPDA
ncbi:hypothetical protein [Paludibaculum fermentans]|uniref:Uncharacterized protein n=1 Tax=Paludibaculum fermentans TaxID=1473598 RepID=A0A7S7SLK9_PALFE|nr:hypothetical protein [Paludibaculum fermentans]QOY90367.1 hypothetical protein IRI77_10545 [Paludibaculum fermentans]